MLPLCKYIYKVLIKFAAYEGTLYNDEALCSCQKGFEKDLEYTTITCSSEGFWSDICTGCKPIKCIEPAEIEYGSFLDINRRNSFNDYVYNDSIKYNCFEGLVL